MCPASHVEGSISFNATLNGMAEATCPTQLCAETSKLIQLRTIGGLLSSSDTILFAINPQRIGIWI